MNLNSLANRGANITDDDVATALEIINSNDRVKSAIYAGRDDLGRPSIDIDMTGLIGNYALGRVISEIYAPDRKASEKAEKAKAKATRLAASEARKWKLEIKRVLALDVPGFEEAPVFQQHLAEYEMRKYGRRRVVQERSKEMHALVAEFNKKHGDFIKAKRSAHEQLEAQKAAELAIHTANIVDGTERQTIYAADIRAKLVAEMNEEDRELFMNAKLSARIWIDWRNSSASDFGNAFRTRVSDVA
jgi:hypothetical protein